MSEKEILEIIQSFESVYKNAGQFAYQKQAGIQKDKKIGSGIAEIDTVTTADLAIQEMVLKEWSKSPLKDCHLVAEEKTESVALFSGQENYYLTIDPIDGTSLYAHGKKYFSIIIGLHNGKEPLYTFVYFPALSWTHKMLGTHYAEIGDKPKISVESGDKTIVYSYGEPGEQMPDIYKDYLSQGYAFKTKKMVSGEAGSTALFLAGGISGYYCENPIVVDGLVILHYAMTKNLKIVRSDNFDLSKYLIGDHGSPQYSGYYLVVR